MRTRILALLLILCFASTASASNGEIGLFFDAQGSLCSKSVGCNESVTLYVYGVLEGASASGIGSAEYALRIGPDQQIDAGWMFEETWSPQANIVLGSAVFPLDIGVGGLERDLQYRGRGVNVAFPTCQTGSNGMVLLQTILVFNNGCNVGELPLLVTAHDTASSQFFQCPTFTLCDAPVFTKVCLGTNLTTCRNPKPPYRFNATCSTSGGAVVNPSNSGAASPCPTTAVEAMAWGGVKNLYR